MKVSTKGRASNQLAREERLVNSWENLRHINFVDSKADFNFDAFVALIEMLEPV